MKTIKTALSLLLALLLMASFSITAFAIPDNDGELEEVEEGQDLIENNGTVTNNNGYIDINKGTVTNNNNIIDTNNGTVTNNNEHGFIGYNDGTVTNNETLGVVVENFDTVEINNGGVVTNQAGATVETNNGTIGFSNDPDSGNYGEVKDNQGTIVYNQDGGTIENNSGTVYNNNGTVVNNFTEGTIEKGTPAQHQFNNYAKITTDGCEGTYSTTGAVTEYDGKYWVEAETSEPGSSSKDGSVTVKPEAGYTFDAPVIDKPDNVTVSGNGSGWTFSFSKLLENIQISISTIKNPQPDPKPVGPVAVATFKLSFDLDGGTIDGKSEYSKAYPYGQVIKLPIPEKNGFTFAGWETVIRGKTVVLEGGARFTVTAAKTFRALWTEN